MAKAPTTTPKPKRERSEKQKAVTARNQFKPGAEWKGNAKGRTPMPQEVRDKAAKYSPEAVDKIYHLMMNSTNEMVQFKAAELFYSMMVSKAPQEVRHDVTVLHASDFLARANARAREIIEGTVVAESLPPPTDKPH